VSRRFTGREYLLALAGLGLVALLALGPHVRDGGFYLDDWSNGAGALQPPGSPNLGDAISYYADLTIYRPVLVLYVPLTYFAFGTDAGLHLAWTAFLSVLAASLFYAVLRTLRVPWYHAWLIAALTIVFPWSDSTRLWSTANQLTLSIALVMAGLLAALIGLERDKWKWHALAVPLYLLSILTYEVALPVIACLGLLYWAVSDWQKARWRWAADISVVLAGAVWVGTHTAREASGLGGDIDHLEKIVTEGGMLLGRAAIALGPARTTLALVALALVIAVGVALCLALPGRFAGSGKDWGLRQWLYLTLGGLAFAALAWVMFIPADPYYTPSVFGMTNRVNGLAAFGLVLVVYGACGIVGSLVGQLRPQSNWLATGTVLVLGAILLGTYTHVLRRHIQIWNTAYVAETTAMKKMRAQLPNLPPGTTVFTSAYPANQTLGVPILSTTWDLNGMVKLEYDDYSLSAYPLVPGLEVACLSQGVAAQQTNPAEGESPGVTAPYGSVRLLDLTSGRHAAPRNRRDCERVASDYVPGPLYLSLEY
jgi:uncharacterized membrane protein